MLATHNTFATKSVPHPKKKSGFMLHSLKFFTICFKITVDYRFNAQLKRKIVSFLQWKKCHRGFFCHFQKIKLAQHEA